MNLSIQGRYISSVYSLKKFVGQSIFDLKKTTRAPSKKFDVSQNSSCLFHKNRVQSRV